MTEKKLKFLRIALAVYVLSIGVAWCCAFEEAILRHETKYSIARIAGITNTIYYLAVWLLALIILIRARLNLGNLLFALLLAANSFAPIVPVLFSGKIYLAIGIVNNLLFFMALFKTFQYFPKPVTREDIVHKVRWKPFRKLLLLAHHDKSWFIFPLIPLALMFTPFQEVMLPLLVIVIIAYLYINLSKSESDRNKVLWLFWGVTIYFACSILNMLFYNFPNEDVQFISSIFSIISVIALLVALTMSFFFFDSFDTGVIIKRTIINSFMLICIVFVYNVMEHYVLHWVSHQLHVSDALVSSILSGILVMGFSPMHHKLMHFLERKLKKHP
ncbi:hypothetical protein FLLO111716_08965 [Flavobacterium longum]|uniref:hypothetical protein n=1 Tax=Flavobacterium longum TaxID=1299340 RepID=UPI0039EBBB75